MSLPFTQQINHHQQPQYPVLSSAPQINVFCTPQQQQNQILPLYPQREQQLPDMIPGESELPQVFKRERGALNAEVQQPLTNVVQNDPRTSTTCSKKDSSVEPHVAKKKTARLVFLFCKWSVSVATKKKELVSRSDFLYDSCLLKKRCRTVFNVKIDFQFSMGGGTPSNSLLFTGKIKLSNYQIIKPCVKILLILCFDLHSAQSFGTFK